MLKVTQLLSDKEPKLEPKAWSNMQIVLCHLPECLLLLGWTWRPDP